MKYFVKIIVVTLSLLIYTHASAEQKIAYLDMKHILNIQVYYLCDRQSYDQ